MTDYDSKIIRRKIRVSGSVQGVGFRYRMEYASSMVGTTGWVRNEFPCREPVPKKYGYAIRYPDFSR